MRKVSTINAPYIGMDVGYGYTKLYREGAALSIPSTIAPWTKFRFTNLGFHSNEEELFGIEIDGKRWMVGDLAVKQSREYIHVLDREKFRSEETRVTAIAGLTLMLYHMASKGNTVYIDEFSAQSPIVIGTGLPVNYYTRNNVNELKKLVGDYHVKLIFPYARKSAKEVDAKFRIAKVVVVVQPYGTYYFLKKQNLLRGYNSYGIVDIGFGTTDFIVVENDIVDETLSGSVDIAMTTVLQEAIRLAELDIDTTALEFKYIQSQLDKGLQKIEIVYGGKKVDIKPYYEEAAKRTAAKLASEVLKVWRNELPEFVFFTGGGARALYGFIKDLDQFEFSDVVELAEYSNVKGFYYIAEAGVIFDE